MYVCMCESHALPGFKPWSHGPEPVTVTNYLSSTHSSVNRNLQFLSFRCGVNEVSFLLGYDAASLGFGRLQFRDNTAVSSLSIETSNKHQDCVTGLVYLCVSAAPSSSHVVTNAVPPEHATRSR